MAEYKTIKGFKTQSYATDPVAATAAWSAGNGMNTGRDGFAAFGIQTAAMAAAGYQTPTLKNETEEYDGTSWSEESNVNTARRLSKGAGTTTAGLIYGGLTTANVDITETWDGTSWTTSPATLQSARRAMGSAQQGTTTAALTYGGSTTPGLVDTNESFDGSTWSEQNDLNTARDNPGGAGTQTAALCFGGGEPNKDVTETWNGTSWTNMNDLNTARPYLGGAGSNTAALAIGGGTYPPVIANTESWDGTSWTEVADLATARANLGGAGTTTSALAFGGANTLTATEEWNDYSGTNPAPDKTMLNEGQIWYNTTGNALKYTIVGAGTWTAENALATGRNQSAQATQATVPTQGLVAGGGAVPGATDAVEEFDGTNWTEKNNLTTARRLLMGAGTTTAMIGFGGLPNIQKTEKWDGTSWTEVNDLLTGREYFGGAGTSTAALAVGNGPYPVPTGKYTEEYDGTSWTEKNDLNTERSGIGTCGLQTAAIAMGGYSGTESALTEIYNGTSWTAANILNTARDNPGASGSTTAALCYSTDTEIWDGTSWTEGANLGTTRSYLQGMGSTSQGSGAALAAGGYSPAGQVGNTESWNATTKTIKTVTVS